MSQRAEQVAQQLRRAVQDVLTRGLNDPRVRGLISVLEVDLSPDFTQAVIRVSVVPEGAGRMTIEGLRSATRHVRSEVAKRVDMRRTPRLEFVLDDSLKRAARVHAALAEVMPEDESTESVDDEQADERRREEPTT